MYGTIPEPGDPTQSLPDADLLTIHAAKRRDREERSKSSSDKCEIDHFEMGFEKQTVYVWHGHMKGRLVRVIQTSGAFAKVSFETATKEKGFLDLRLKDLLAYVPTTFGVTS